MEEGAGEPLQASDDTPALAVVDMVPADLLDLMDAPLTLVLSDLEVKEEPPSVAEAAVPELIDGDDGAGEPDAEPGSPSEAAVSPEGPEAASARSGEDEEQGEQSEGSIDDETRALLGARAGATTPTKAPTKEATRRETLLASAVGALGALRRGAATAEPDKETANKDNVERMQVRALSL